MICIRGTVPDCANVNCELSQRLMDFVTVMRSHENSDEDDVDGRFDLQTSRDGASVAAHFHH